MIPDKNFKTALITIALPRISVVISAHDRTEYLASAIQSVLDQDFPRESIEIVCVKNFEHREIDQFCADNNVKTVLVGDSPLGFKMATGVENSTGELIAFLDDDDRFAGNKLTSLWEYFQKFPDMTYYHNSITPMDEEGNLASNAEEAQPLIIHMPESGEDGVAAMIAMRADWYASTMAVPRKIAEQCLEYLYTLPASFDKIVFLAGLTRKGTMIADNRRLTHYRIHESLTTVKADFPDFIRRKAAFYLKSMNAFESISGKEKSALLKEVAGYYKDRDSINLAILSGETNHRSSSAEAFSFLAVSLKWRIWRNMFWLMLLALSLLSRKAVQHIYYNYMSREFEPFLS